MLKGQDEIEIENKIPGENSGKQKQQQQLRTTTENSLELQL